MYKVRKLFSILFLQKYNFFSNNVHILEKMLWLCGEKGEMEYNEADLRLLWIIFDFFGFYLKKNITFVW